MGYRRHVNNIVETASEVSFDLVLNTEDNLSTLGGGRVTVPKPVTDDLLRQRVDEAIAAIVRDGDLAFPKTRPEGPVDNDSPAARVMREYVRGLNLQDWPQLARRRR